MGDRADWWTEFFQGPFLGVQLGLTFGDGRATRTEVDALAGALELAEGSRVLDVPCGTGRHSLELARRGHHVTGVDFNPAVLDTGRAEAAAEGLGVDFRRGDMRGLDFDGEFDAAICHWGSFGYFGDDENEGFVRGISRALRPAGKFFLDTHVAETLYPKVVKRDFQYHGEGEQRLRVLQERRIDHETGRVESTWIFQKGGREETHSISIRVYTYRELSVMFAAAGMRIVAATDGAGKPFEVGSNRLWLVTQKE
ncbi:MAG TPA: methyltransferase domain-containing protein [Polyangiaceae bacterium]|nr:methyltransferase domain-containing protein [Polyangiaceae bacterium]